MISFVRFLVNFSKEPTLAIKYLTSAKTSKQSIQDNFFIYKYEMILEDICKNRVALNDMGSINVLNVLKYEKYQKIFNDLLEQSALMHNQFWSSLLDESPNMSKVCDVGFKVLTIEDNVERYWKKIQAIYPNNPKDLITYANYLKQVWNDSELAAQVTDRAKEFAYSGKYAVIFTTNSQDISNFSTDGSACLFVSGDKVTPGERRVEVVGTDNELQLRLLQVVRLPQEGRHRLQHQSPHARTHRQAPRQIHAQQPRTNQNLLLHSLRSRNPHRRPPQQQLHVSFVGENIEHTEPSE